MATKKLENEMKTGEAYAFFDCNACKGEIEETIPVIRKMINAPGKLELSLKDGINPDDFEEAELASIAREAKDEGINYVLEAKYEGATNRQTADELALIMNQAYQSQLYQKGEQFRGAIFYKEEGRYLTRE
ncbi:MAG: hypothetical protein ACP5OG_01355 [Candidatus Nanoarchaeia archaeon]